MNRFIALWRYFFPVITLSRDEFFEFIKKPIDKDGYVSKATEHYMNFYDRYIHEGKAISWNWAALTGMWFFYRKMYGFFLIHIMATVLFAIDEYYTHLLLISEEEHLIFITATYLLIVAFSDYLYLSHAQKKYIKNSNKKNISTNSKKLTIVFFIIYETINTILYMHRATTEPFQPNIESLNNAPSISTNMTYAHWLLGEKNHIPEVDKLMIYNAETDPDIIFIDWAIAHDICSDHFKLEKNASDKGRLIWRVEGMPDPSKITAMMDIQNIKDKEKNKNRLYSREEIEGTT